MFKKFIRKIKKYFQVEPIAENPFGRKTPGIKLTLKNKNQRTIDQINSIILNCCFVDKFQINNTDNLINDLGMDSLDIVELIFYLEEQFSIEISDEDFYNVIEVKDIYNLIESKL